MAVLFEPGYDFTDLLIPTKNRQKVLFLITWENLKDLPNPFSHHDPNQ
jgi:hypothetical protein